MAESAQAPYDVIVDGVTVYARNRAGAEQTLLGSYLAGCDGGRSIVRKKLGIKLEGRGNIQDTVQVIFWSEDLYERIMTGKGRHYAFPDAGASTLVVQGDRKEFTLHSSLPPDTDFEPALATGWRNNGDCSCLVPN
jgi:2-polyprenyl-6-methoxyphenol hydroxylase-like FAD-dependent oxidoreductase